MRQALHQVVDAPAQPPQLARHGVQVQRLQVGAAALAQLQLHVAQHAQAPPRGHAQRPAHEGEHDQHHRAQRQQRPLQRLAALDHGIGQHQEQRLPGMGHHIDAPALALVEALAHGHGKGRHGGGLGAQQHVAAAVLQLVDQILGLVARLRGHMRALHALARVVFLFQLVHGHLQQAVAAVDHFLVEVVVHDVADIPGQRQHAGQPDGGQGQCQLAGQLVGQTGRQRQAVALRLIHARGPGGSRCRARSGCGRARACGAAG